MKYIASTRPMIRNMITCSRPCASGWRETPAMVALPARPSPTAAPIAPPPSARPAPISAPATAIAWFMLGGSSCLCLVLRDGRVLWLAGSLRVGRVHLLIQTLASLAEVDDRQQHEDECLDGAHEEDVEELPGDERGGRERRRPGDRLWDQGDQVDHQQ